MSSSAEELDKAILTRASANIKSTLTPFPHLPRLVEAKGIGALLES